MGVEEEEELGLQLGNLVLHDENISDRNVLDSPILVENMIPIHEKREEKVRLFDGLRP